MMDNNTVERFTFGERLGHWIHVVSFITLLITGAGLVFYSFSNLLGIEGLKIFRNIHHLMAYPFTFLTIIILLVGAPQKTIQWIKECFSWNKDDVNFVKAFPKEFFNILVKLPPQGKYNGGQKINSLITIFGSLLMIITGWIMIFANSFSSSTVSWALALHSGGALVLGAIMLGHAYLGLLHPGSRESIKGMLSGKVSRKFAEEHHNKWYRNIGA